jgi:hypothetical protein
MDDAVRNDDFERAGASSPTAMCKIGPSLDGSSR